MNNDTLFTIAQFAGPKQAMRMTSEFAGKFFPRSITIVGHKQLEEFYGWARHLNTSNLTEVRIVVQESKFIESLRTDFPKAMRADGLVIASPIGLVPPSVKKLTLCVWTDERVEISDTVEELVIESIGSGYYRGLAVPDSVRSLHLMDGFDGFVYKWPDQLERLCLNGWSGGNGRWPVPIDGLPDTIKHLTLGAHLDIEIIHWPEQLETLVIEGDPESHGWQLEDIDVPEGVEVIIMPSAGATPEVEEELPDSIWDL